MCFIRGKSPNNLSVRMSCRQVKDGMTHSGDDLLGVQLRIQAGRISRGNGDLSAFPLLSRRILASVLVVSGRCQRMDSITISFVLASCYRKTPLGYIPSLPVCFIFIHYYYVDKSGKKLDILLL